LQCVDQIGRHGLNVFLSVRLCRANNRTGSHQSKVPLPLLLLIEVTKH
jgi:hypothetical protein